MFSVTIVFLIAVIAALSGFIINVEQGRTLEPTVRYSLGAVYPTDLASRCFYLLLSYTALRKFKFTIPEYIAALAFTVLIYVVTDTRLDFLLMIAVVLIVIFRNTLFKVIKTLKTGIATSVIFIIILLNIVLAYLFNPDVYVFQIINKLLSGRLTYGHEAFKNYNVPLLGQFVYQNGNGGVHNQPFAYFYIDVSFIRVLMMEGIVAFFVLLVVIYFLYKKFYNGKIILCLFGCC